MIVSGCMIGGVTSEMVIPISEQAIRRILREIGMETIIGDNIYINLDAQTSSTTMDSEGKAIIQGNRVDCDVNYILDPLKTKYEITTTIHRSEYGNTLYEIRNLEPIFREEITNTAIYEHCVPCEIEIKGSIKLIDKNIADGAFTAFDSTTGNRVILCDLFYHYLLPDPALVLMAYVYDRSGVRATDVKFSDYMFNRSSNKIGYIINKHLARNDITYVVNKTEIEMVLDADPDDDKPQAVKTSGKSVNHYAINFTASCQFNRPDNLYMVYPIIMNNELVDQIFLPEEIQTLKENLYNTIHPYFDMHHGDLALQKEVKQLVPATEVYKVPFYDNFQIPHMYLTQFGFDPFISIAFPLDLTNTITSIDLESNLGSDDLPIRIKTEVLDVIRNQGKRMLTGQCPIAVVILKDDIMINPEIINVNNLTLSIPNIDPTKIYRLVLMENKKETDYVPSLRVLKADLIARCKDSITN